MNDELQAAGIVAGDAPPIEWHLFIIYMVRLAGLPANGMN